MFIVDSSDLISAPTRAAADEGISALDPVLLAGAQFALGSPQASSAFQAAARRLSADAIVKLPGGLATIDR